MFYSLTGPLDIYQAIALLGMFAMFAAIIIAGISKYKSPTQYSLEHKKLDIDADRQRFVDETHRMTSIKQLQENLITSHRAE